MQWREEGIILSVRPHGEGSAIADILTEAKGRTLGLVRGGRSRIQRPVLQTGNFVVAQWRARLEEHLGNFTVEPLALKAGTLIDEPFRLAGLTTLTALAQLLPEREPHPRIYNALKLTIEQLENDDVWPALLVRWELGLLDELGFGLDLARCAVTGSADSLAFVSPRSGRAVSRKAAEPYVERLLPLPAFLLGRQAGSPTAEEVAQGLRLTGHFLARHILEPRTLPMPESRSWIEARLRGE
jgi:DNA repair protein RecO (recombination protein O)